jgi:glycogen debranching enzyme
VSGLLSRRYHGLLVAALKPPLGRTLLVAKLDETLEYGGGARPLFANRWADGTVDPRGYREMERFRLEGTTPVWTFAVADALLEKRVFMEPGANTTYVQYWFGDWGRDTMIALPGLTVATGRPEIGRRILSTFARFVDRGMLPNRFPDAGEAPEYNTVDATLWYFEAVRAYHAATGDDALLRALFPVLEEIVRWHRQGTRYGIGEDPADGLLRSGEPGVQLTWMDAKVGEWVVTPRSGKPVEINALWYNALAQMAAFARRLGHPVEPWAGLAARVRRSFERFWNEAAGYCYDVIDGPEGHDAALRPNQLLARLAPREPAPARAAAPGRAAPEAAAVDLAQARRVPPPPPRNWTWAALMRRAFALDVLACPRCGGRLRVIVTVEHPVAVRQLLAARRPAETLGPGPP